MSVYKIITAESVFEVEFVVLQGVRNVSSISLAINYPTLASVPHSVINGFKNLLAIAVVTDIDFAEAETVCLLSQIIAVSSFIVHFLMWPVCMPTTTV